MSTMQRLAAQIKSSRMRMGYSQEQLAEMLDITPTHVKHLESGHRRPSVELLFNLAEVLHFSVDQIIFPMDIQKEELRMQINRLLEDCTVKEHRIVLDLILSIIKNHEP